MIFVVACLVHRCGKARWYSIILVNYRSYLNESIHHMCNILMRNVILQNKQVITIFSRYGYQNKIHRNHFTFDFCAITHKNQFLFTCNSLLLYIIIYERKRNLHKLEQIHILSLLLCDNVGILALSFIVPDVILNCWFHLCSIVLMSCMTN